MGKLITFYQITGKFAYLVEALVSLGSELNLVLMSVGAGGKEPCRPSEGIVAWETGAFLSLKIVRTTLIDDDIAIMVYRQPSYK